MLQMFRRRHVETEINDEERHGMTFLGQGFAVFLTARMFAQKLLISVNNISIGRDQIGIHRPAIRRRDACNAVAFCMDIRHFGIELHLATNIFEQADKPLYLGCMRGICGSLPHHPDYAI